MARPKFVQIPSHPIERFRPLLGDDYPRVEAAAERARRQFEGRAIWHVSSTLRGGGVAEMLRTLLPYVRGAGLDTRWVVLREAVADDPEGSAVWSEVRGAWRALSERIRRRVHLANLPMDDLDENGAMVNAIQRRADAIVQKSIAEGFGLTVAEAMWKGKPVIGSRVGGIQDQIVDGESGVLVDPTDPEGRAG